MVAKQSIHVHSSTSPSDICRLSSSDVAPKLNLPRKRRVFTLRVERGLSIRDAMNAIEARLAAHRAEQERLWDEILGSDRALTPTISVELR